MPKLVGAPSRRGSRTLSAYHRSDFCNRPFFPCSIITVPTSLGGAGHSAALITWKRAVVAAFGATVILYAQRGFASMCGAGSARSSGARLNAHCSKSKKSWRNGACWNFNVMAMPCGACPGGRTTSSRVIRLTIRSTRKPTHECGVRGAGASTNFSSGAPNS